MTKLQSALRLIGCTVRPALVLGTLAFPAVAGPAIDQFEVKDLETAPGEAQFQSQNAFSIGQPSRRVVQTSPGNFAYDDNTVARERYALELQMGLTHWFRVRLGAEFEKERVDEPASPSQANAFESLRLSSIAIEGVAVLVPVKGNGVGLGLLAEYDAAVGGGDSQFYIGPIIQAVSGPWSATANLMLVQHSGSRGALDVPPDRKRDFSYAVQLQYAASAQWAFAVEAYGTFDRIGGSGTPTAEQALLGDFDQHRLGPVVYYRFNPGNVAEGPAMRVGRARGGEANDDAGGDRDDANPVSVGFGVLFGLNKNTPDQTFKLSVEYNF